MPRQWAGYLLVVGIGASVNYGVYAALIYTSAAAVRHLLYLVAAGSLSGLLFNLFLIRRYIFAE